MNRSLRVLALVVGALSTTALLGAALTRSAGPTIAGFGGWALPNIVVGTMLTYRRPRLIVGWLFAAIGFLVASGTVAEVLAHAGLALEGAMPWWGVLGAWYGEVYWLPLVFTTLIFVPMLFPDGSPPTPFFRRATVVMVATLLVLMGLAAVQEHLDVPGVPAGTPPIPNPIGVPGLEDVEEGVVAGFLVVALGAFLVITLVALVKRFRRSRGVERQQLKWFTSAGAVLIVGFVVQGVLDDLFNNRQEAIDIVLFALPPVAAGVAIVRYRLYAIDRIISRTVTYALLTALLVALYLAAVTSLTALTAPVAGNSPIAVAAATLLAAAAFGPARSRIQRAVDRRFNRSRYDAVQTVDQFRAHLRDELELGAITEDLQRTVALTVQPQRSFVWLDAKGQS